MFSLTLFLFVSSKRNIIEARKFVRKQKLTDDHLKNYCVDLNLLALLACYCLKNVIFLYHHIIVSLYIWRSFGTLCLGTKWKMELWYCGFTRRFFYWILNYLPLQSSPGPNQIQETDETNIFWKTNRSFFLNLVKRIFPFACVQCGCTVLAKLWRLVRCTITVSR